MTKMDKEYLVKRIMKLNTKISGKDEFECLQQIFRKVVKLQQDVNRLNK